MIYQLKPLVACPHSPDKVVSVSSLKGIKVNQKVIGSCTNSSAKIYLVSPEVAAVSAITDYLTDPKEEGKYLTRDLGGNTGTIEYAEAVINAITKGDK
jgi:aconitate hydratase